MTRTYRQRRRAEKQEETRQRIVDATVELHRELGPAKTTITAIAERAGVQRLTVYRHFPDERSLYLACSSRFVEQHPFPNPEEWCGIEDPEERLRVALNAFFQYYEQAEDMLEKVFHDAAEDPVLQEVNAPYLEQMMKMQQDIASAFSDTGELQPRILTAVGHALDFFTWRSLVRVQGLDSESAAEMLTEFVRSSSQSGRR